MVYSLGLQSALVSRQHSDASLPNLFLVNKREHRSFTHRIVLDQSVELATPMKSSDSLFRVEMKRRYRQTETGQICVAYVLVCPRQSIPQNAQSSKLRINGFRTSPNPKGKDSVGVQRRSLSCTAAADSSEFPALPARLRGVGATMCRVFDIEHSIINFCS